jgi:predicted DNA-binding transcriptional regulator YafY
MATNKNALIRYKVLDRCFRNPGKKYFIDDLIEECSNVLAEINSETNGISRRQIMDDIAFMESSEGWSIELGRHHEGRRVYYRYANTDFSINDMPLNDVEIDQLKSAIQILSQFKGMPQFEWMNELLPKLQQGASSKRIKPVIGFDSNQYLKGIEFVGELYTAINFKNVLKITYQDFKSDQPYELIIHPFYLKQYNNRWFLFGFNQENNRYNWNLALDRIIGIKECKNKYHVNDQVDWEEYFEDIIGVTKPENEKMCKVVLHFNGDTCRYIETKPLHGSQKAKWISEDVLEVSLEVLVNFELKRLILSYGDKVKVVGPATLATAVQQELKKASLQYETRTNTTQDPLLHG